MAEVVEEGVSLTRAGRAFGLATTYVGTVVGAGFASGQEIWVFFGRFGGWGFAGLALAGVLFALAGERAFMLGREGGQGTTYYQSLQLMFGALAPFFDLILLVFLCVLGGVMLAGSGALALTLGWSSHVGVMLTAFLAMVVLAAGIPGIVTVNKLVVPCLILAAGAVALLSPGQAGETALPAARAGWLPAALLYVSYNTVLSLPVLFALGRAEPDRRLLRAGSICGAVCLFAVAALILHAICKYPVASARAEVPMAAIAVTLGKPLGVGYAFVLWAEMFTTLLADVFGAAVRFQQVFGGKRLAWVGIAMALGVILSRLGFARLVRTAYPAFGLVCLVVLQRLLRPRMSHRARPPRRPAMQAGNHRHGPTRKDGDGSRTNSPCGGKACVGGTHGGGPFPCRADKIR